MANYAKLGEKALEELARIEASTAKSARAIGKKKAEVIPPPFERAPAKTKEELDLIAQRVAPQLTGEFVRLDPTRSVNPAGLSKSRFEYEKSLQHDIRPVQEVKTPSTFDYAANQGKVQFGVFGDPTLAQHDIYGVASRQFAEPSRQYGGPRYPMYEPSDAWASNFGAASGVQSAAKRASKQYGDADVVGIYTKMGKDSYGFAQHISDALMKNIALSLSDMSKKDIAGFNKMIRNNPAAKDFAGIENPDIALAQMEKNPEMRKQFYKLATTPKYTSAFNMPNGLDVVHATLEPDLRNLEIGMTGHSVVELDPSIEHLHAAEHPTYDTRIPRKEGTEVQQLEVPVPYELQFPDQLLEISKNPEQAPHSYGTLKMQGARQIIDPQLIDEIGQYRDFIKKYTGKKKGGAVKMADGGKVFKAALKVLEEAGNEVKLPPAENSARTQIVGTINTYHKARDILKGHGIEGEKIIDLGAGKGLGSTIMKAHSMEPYPQGWEPTFKRAADIPSDTYEGLTNLNVLNVVAPDIRREIVEDIGRVLKPKGGVGLITTRGKDVLNTVNGVPGPEPMSVITSRDTYQKGFTPQELHDYVKEVLGDKFEYEKLDLGPAGVKIIKKADGGKIELDKYEPDAPVDFLDNPKPTAYETLKNVVKNPGTYAKTLGKKAVEEIKEEAPRKAKDVSDILNDYLATYGGSPVDIANMALKPIGLGSEKPFLGSEYIKEKMVNAGLHSGAERPLINIASTLLTPKTIATTGAKAAEGYGNLIKEGVERNIHRIEPRMGIIKDPGGMLVSGETELERELRHIKKDERPNLYTNELAGMPLEDMINQVSERPKDPNAVALNNWIDTKVKKYIRNQAGTENDPILKTIESGVQYNFDPAMGDTKYMTKVKRAKAGFPEEGTATTDLGKEWQYKVDSIFKPHTAEDIKEIYRNPNINEKQKQSRLRIEHDLPIYDEKDYDALKLINEIPDKNVYTIGGTNIARKLGLDHVSDVLHEDLASGRLQPEQLDQMSIEKAIRRTAEYDAQKAREMTKAHATSVEGMPVPKTYDDGYKWVELKHETDPAKTKSALKSEGEMMGHCVGSYCPQVESGGTQIFSLRGPDNKSHVTIEVSKKSHLGSWLKANEEEINKDPLIKQMHYPSPDERYHQMYTEEELDEIYKNDIAKMLRMKGAPVHEPQDAWIDIVQVKGKQNKRPDDKYQKYVTDFVKSNVAKHEITDIRELQNTNLHDIQSMIAEGIVPKDIHFHPEITKTLKARYPEFNKLMASDKEDMTYQLFKDIAKDFARKGQYYITNEDIIDAAKAMSPAAKKRGGPITKKDLENQMKLDDIVDIPNLRRRYG